MTKQGRILGSSAAVFGLMFAGIAFVFPAVSGICLWLMALWFVLGLIALIRS